MLPCQPQQCVRMVLLFIEALEEQGEEDRDESMMTVVMERALKSLDAAVQQRPNEVPVLRHTEAIITAR